MNRHLWLVAALLSTSSLVAQNTMRVHYKGGGTQDISIAQIDSVTFVDKETSAEQLSLTGSWLWGSVEQGYFELLTFNDDRTYSGYDNYFTYGFDTMTYGWWRQTGAMLTLQSNGFGYQRRYNWFVVGLTENSLEVMTKMGPFTYYKLQPEPLNVGVAEYYSGFADGDSIVFVDGVLVRADGNRLQGLFQGTSYVLVRKAAEDRIVAYKVIVK